MTSCDLQTQRQHVEHVSEEVDSAAVSVKEGKNSVTQVRGEASCAGLSVCGSVLVHILV